jgi:hypothetical protein
LEAVPTFSALCRLSLIFVDHQYPFPRPTQRRRSVGQVILQLFRLTMLQHLLRIRLPNINYRQAFVMAVRDFRRAKRERR